MILRQPVAENAIHRDGYQPFSRTIGELITEKAKVDVRSAFVRHDLECIRLEGRRKPRHA